MAGIAELGPYILSYKGFKLRVYRMIWNIVQQYWTAERWIRIGRLRKLEDLHAYAVMLA